MKQWTLAILLACPAVAAADSWEQWMGPKRDGVWRETGIVDKLPASPKFLWKTPVSIGFSGPAVFGSRVFLTDFVTDVDVTSDNFSRDKYSGKERVLCLDVFTGKILWKHEYPATYSVSYPNGPRCTPTVDGARVYTLGAEGDLICFGSETGDIVWKRDLKKDFGAKTPLWGFAAHPLVDGQRLICMVGGKGSVTVAFDKMTGNVLWKALDAKEPGYSPPLLTDVGGKPQLVVWHPEALNGLDPETGKVHWSVKQDTVNGCAIMSPRQLGSDIFVGGWKNKGGLFRLDANAPGAKLVWKNNRDNSVAPVNNTPFLEGGHLYGVCTSGELRCVRLADGERVWETYQPVAGKEAGSGTAHLVKHGDRFFIMSETGDLVLAKLSPKAYEELGRIHLVDPTSKAHGRSVVWSHPAFANRCVFARNDREIVCVSLAKE